MDSARTAAGGDPLLSVVVTIVEGVESLPRLLDALRGQVNPPPLDVLVPFDASVGSVAALQDRYPEVRWLDLSALATERPSRSAAGQHELYDRRRAAGLQAARGDLVAILEDRGAPAPSWARTVVLLHGTLPHPVIGGAIEPEPSSLLNWAYWVCDFSRYGLPFRSGAVDWVSDVNVTYKRWALEQTRELWRERYQEPVVHWALMERGGSLYLSADLVVHHRLASQRLLALLPQRFDWGRLFGAIRARHSGPARRLALVVASPLVPFLVLARHARAQTRRGDGVRFLRALPLLLPLLLAWTAGETWGQVTGRS